jgi:hypothetical protein
LGRSATKKMQSKWESSWWNHKDEQEEEIRSKFTEKGLMVFSFILLDEERNSRFTCSSLFSVFQSMKFV